MDTKKWNIVLDIDSTLVNTFEGTGIVYEIIKNGDKDLNFITHQSYCFDVIDPEADGTSEPYYMWGLYRPHLTEFILYCIENFKNVYIWSAGSKKYVDCMVEHIFPLLNYNPPVVLNRKDTVCLEDDEVVNKPLTKVYKLSNGEANETNTLILDDREDTFSINRDNGILIPRFDLDGVYDEQDEENYKADEVLESISHYLRNDNCLAELIQYFEKHKDVSDVRTLPKENIFTCCNRLEENFSLKFRTGTQRLSPSMNLRR